MTTPVTTAAAPVAVVARRWPIWYNVVLLCGAAVLISYIDRTNISVASISMQAQFGWTQTAKGWVLSSFFIGYLAFMAVSGALANRYGGKVILGAAVLWWSAFTALTPPAALVSLPALIGARIALGLGEAAVFPASVNMIGRWVPVANRSRAVAFFTSALSIGTVISLPVTGWLVSAHGWPMPFYAFGALGIVWAIAWFSTVSGGRSTEIELPSAEHRAIPWRRLLRSSAVWAIIINHFCSNWALYVLLAWLPSYFKTTFDVSLSNAGLLSAAPWLAYFVMGNVGGWIADVMIGAGRSVTFVRKAMQIGALVGSGAFLLLMQTATSPTMAMFLMCGASGTLALCLSGFAVNSFDIAPRHADVIWGLANSAGTIPGIIGVAVTGWLIDRTGSFNAPFFLTASVGFVGAVVYLFFASGEREVE
ncbi:MAG TPA: ACS family MFS transporter [Gemmatimonadaceae bacterium]|jgi:MFS transporter, ACS family, solute carrier family 17 (sodium-dependent inorganic phosphate cotransporter), other|nr:ACS family MFS transporter [Gemmatimonadaceae bacterium]